MRKETEYSIPWEKIQAELFTPEEIEMSRIRASIASIMFEVSQARKNKKMTQKELGEITGLTQPAIARLESGQAGATLETMMKVLIPLGYTLKVEPVNQ